METDVLFPGLHLAAGPYYLVVDGGSSNNQEWWANNPSDTLLAGATVSNAYSGLVTGLRGGSAFVSLPLREGMKMGTQRRRRSRN